MADTPYTHLDPSRFWRSGVATRSSGQYPGFYEPKFKLPETAKVMTAGSCFAQHIGHNLRRAGLDIADTEPLPEKIPKEIAQAYGYGLYSARYGNIYTSRQLRQLFQEAYDTYTPEDIVWSKDGRYFDAFRPALEPHGLDSAADVHRHRQAHLRMVRKAIEQTDTFIFTFGLTEAWRHKTSGTVFPIAPGVVVGEFDPDEYEFVNFRYEEVLQDFLQARDIFKQGKKEARFIVTVSPVPLTATAADMHVELATSYSKSVLRAVCGELCATYDDIDYMPSFEIITSQRNGAGFYEDNLRSVKKDGVTSAMKVFLDAHELKHKPPAPNKYRPDDIDRLVCEEILLDKFSGA